MNYSNQQLSKTVVLNSINNIGDKTENEKKIIINNSNIVGEYNYIQDEIIHTNIEQPLKSSLSNSTNSNEITSKMEIGEKKSISSCKTSKIIEDNYGYIKDKNGHKVKVTKYSLLNNQGTIIEVIDYGATVVSCWVPDKQGNIEDVLLGFDSIEDYKFRNTYSIGSTLGRVTDYISHGCFKNDKGVTYKLSKNLENHHFNGGKNGFDKVMWDGYVANDKLVLTYSSRDGEEGYPGTFQIRITFWLTCKNELIIDYVGMTSKSTPVNITSNMFFNLAGHKTGESEISNHSIMVNANEYIAIKIPERTPVGLIKDVCHTCLDLRVPRLLKKAFPLVPGFGYNHTFKLFKGNEGKDFNLAASLMHKPSGRILDVYTDMPCIFVNTAQDFQNYGKMLFKEKMLKVAEIATPLAVFGENGNEQEENSVYNEYKSSSNLELMMENEGEVEHHMETIFTQPNVQESLPIIGKSKVVYTQHSGVCIRPQLFPDAVSHKNFNSTILQPPNIYSQQTIYKFGIMVSNSTK